MPLFTRVEFSVGPSLKSRRVVLLLEFPDEVLQQIHKRKSGSEVEAYPIALEAIGALKFDVTHGSMTFKRLSIPRIKPSFEEPILTRCALVGDYPSKKVRSWAKHFQNHKDT